MIFLLEYDRPSGQLISIEPFEDDAADAADDRRLALELSLMDRQLSREVVLLQASSEAQLRRTHRRYFARVEELASASIDPP